MKNTMSVVKVSAGSSAGVGTLTLAYFVERFLSMNPFALLVFEAAAGLVALLLFVWLVVWIWEKVSERRYRAERHRLAVQGRRAEISLVQEQRATEILARDRAWEYDQRLLEIEENRARWEAGLRVREVDARLTESSLIHFNQNEVLAVRGPGGQVDIAYVPMPRVERVYEGSRQTSGLVSFPGDVQALPSPRMPGAMEVVRSGALEVPGEIIMGFNDRSEAVRRAWKKVKAVLILGLQGGGKTNTAIWLLVQVLLQGGKLALIDKHGRSEEDSMYQQVKIFEQKFITPAGDSPQAALRVIGRVKAIFYGRMEGEKIDYPLLLVVDEFSAIMRQAGTDEKWSEVADKLGALLEELNEEGRKHGCYAVCIGQVANASRSGGTEVRDTFNTRIIHGMREKQAGLVGLSEEKKAIRKLETGQAFIDMEGQDEPFFVQVPHVTSEVLTYVASRISGQKQAVNSGHLPRVMVSEQAVQGSFVAGSSAVRSGELGRSGTLQERSVNALEQTVQTELEKLSEREERVMNLVLSGVGKQSIIEEVWGVKKGGSERYKQAVTEYTQIIEKLAVLELVTID